MNEKSKKLLEFWEDVIYDENVDLKTRLKAAESYAKRTLPSLCSVQLSQIQPVVINFVDPIKAARTIKEENPELFEEKDIKWPG